jgi:hypothetical protein
MDKQQYEEFQQMMDGAPIPLPVNPEPAINPFDARMIAKAAEQRAFERMLQEDFRQDAHERGPALSPPVDGPEYGSDAWRALRRLEKSVLDSLAAEADGTVTESDDGIEAAARAAYAKVMKLSNYADLHDPEEFEAFMTEHGIREADIPSADEPMQEPGYEAMDLDGDVDVVELAKWEPLHPVVPIPDRGLAGRDMMMTEPAGMMFTQAEYLAFAAELDAAERAAQANLAGYIEVGECVEGADYPEFAEFIDLTMFDDDDEPAISAAANTANAINATNTVNAVSPVTLDRVFESADGEQDYSQQYVDIDMADMAHLDSINPSLLEANTIDPSLLEADTIDPSLLEADTMDLLLFEALDHQAHLAGHRVYPQASTLKNGPNRTATEMDGGSETSEPETESETESETEPETEPKLKRGQGSRAAIEAPAVPAVPKTRAATKDRAATEAPATPKTRAATTRARAAPKAPASPAVPAAPMTRAATRARAETEAPTASRTRAATKARAATKLRN